MNVVKSSDKFKGKIAELSGRPGLFSRKVPVPLAPISHDVPESNRRAIDNVLRTLSVSAADSVNALQPMLISGFIPRNKHRIQGVVVSSKMDKTIVVLNERRVQHPLYKRVLTIAKKFYAHDECNSAQEGDYVGIIESRPISKTKHWRLEAILRRKSKGDTIPEWLRVPPLIMLSIPDLTAKLKHDLTYQIHVRVQGRQDQLFEERTAEAKGKKESGSSERVLTEAKKMEGGPSGSVELIVKVIAPALRPTPSVLLVKSVMGRPIVQPQIFSISPTGLGVESLVLSVLVRSSGELIQSQVFEFEVE